MKRAPVVAVLSFAYLASTWALTAEQEAKLLPHAGTVGGQFGNHLALDGNTALIGAYEDDASGQKSGSAYVFTRTDGVWGEQERLTPPDGSPYDRFGHSVALDGDTILVGSTGDDEIDTDSGAVYVFTRTGGVWTFQDKLLASDGTHYDRFGNSVALDGDTALIGAVLGDGNFADTGSAYVFRLYDTDVPAVGHMGTALLLLAGLATGVYGLRRRTAD